MLKDYKLGRLADSDLEDIWDYTVSEWGTAQAQKYLEDINIAIIELLAAPNIGRTRHDLQTNLLFHRVKQHYVIYNYDNDYLYVARILHVTRDMNAHLF